MPQKVSLLQPQVCDDSTSLPWTILSKERPLEYQRAQRRIHDKKNEREAWHKEVWTSEIWRPKWSISWGRIRVTDVSERKTRQGNQRQKLCWHMDIAQEIRQKYATSPMEEN